MFAENISDENDLFENMFTKSVEDIGTYFG